MYNIVKDGICSSIRNSFVRNFYYKAFNSNYEIAYINSNNLFVKVIDEEVGKRLYNVLKYVKAHKIVVDGDKVSIKIHDYAVSRKKAVKWFLIKGDKSFYYWYISKITNTIGFSYILECFEKEGLVLDPDYMKNMEIGPGFSVLLSAFMVVSDDEQEARTQIENSRASFIEYAHHALSWSNKTLEEAYGGLVEKGEILVKEQDFGYNLSFIKVCYDFYKNHIIPENIYEIIQDYDPEAETPQNVAYALSTDFSDRYSITEQTEDYTVYDGFIKIYNKGISYKEQNNEWYEKFLCSSIGFLKNYNQYCLEELDCLIFSMDKEFIGSKFQKKKEAVSNKIVDAKFKNQVDIIDFIKSMEDFVSIYKLAYISQQGLNSLDLFNLYTTKTDFNIEESIVYSFDPNSGKCLFKIISIKEMLNIMCISTDDFYKQLMIVFFKLLAKFLNRKYGELKTKADLIEKIEVRSLKPLITAAFIQYVLNDFKEISTYKSIIKKGETLESFKSMLNTRLVHEDTNNKYYYDSCLMLDPTDFPFSFYDEIEKKYNLKLKKGDTVTLPDGRKLVYFHRAKPFEDFAFKLQDKMYDVGNIFNGKDEYIKIAGISEIIYSSSLNSENQYKFLGYIQEPIKGKKLTEQYLTSLSNKDLYNIAGLLFSKFTPSAFIPNKYIYAEKSNNNYNFYIDILDSKFEFKESNEPSVDYINIVFDSLCKTKPIYKIYLAEWYAYKAKFNLSAMASGKSLSELLDELGKGTLKIAQNYDKYCNEHKMWYKSSKNLCPICAATKYKVTRKEEYLFEDEYAKHYKINDKLYLKLYKPINNMDILEKNVANLCNMTKTKAAEFLHQDCFVPIKKAINQHDKFIGCVYLATRFERDANNAELCIDVSELDVLPMLKSLKRLMLQIEELIGKEKPGFVMNPFSHVFLSPSHKKQVQILNVEFFCKGKYAVDNNLTGLTYEWACRYVSDVLNSEKSITLNKKCKEIVDKYCAIPRKIIDPAFCAEDFKILLSGVTVLSVEMTKYCVKHKEYYSNKFLFCPKCMPDIALQKELSIKEKKDIIIANEPENEGGESFIYSYKNGLIAKIFKSEMVNISKKEDILCNIMMKRKTIVDIDSKAENIDYVIPEKVLIDADKNEVYGYIMHPISGAQPVSNLKHKSIVEDLGFTRKEVLELLITIGEGIELLHEKANIYIGDLNGQNILFDSNKKVYFIDFDGMGIDNIIPEFCTDGYIDPVSKETKNITMKDDWYSFAIQTFYYLTYTHPFNGIYYDTTEEGKKVLLDIPEKMKKRVSLLGKHGLTPPSIAESWDWMMPELVNTFLKIFEGDLRVSIVPLLKKQYDTLYSNNNEKTESDVDNSEETTEKSEDESETIEEKVIRINPKFIAKELHPFKVRNKNADTKLVKVFNQYAAMYEDDNGFYLTILPNEEFKKRHIKKIFKTGIGGVDWQVNVNISYFPGSENVFGVKFTDDGEYAVIIATTYIKVVPMLLDIKSNDEMMVDDLLILNEDEVVVCNNSFYIKERNSTKLVKWTIMKNKLKLENIPAIPYSFGKEPNIRWYDILEDHRIGIFISRKKDGTNLRDVIVYNGGFLCNLPCEHMNTQYKFLYGKNPKMWICINSEGNGITITPARLNNQIYLGKFVHEDNLSGVLLKDGRIYIPNHTLTIYDVNTEQVKQLQCEKVMNSNSKILDVTNRGFIVKTNNTLYEVYRG